MSPWRRTLSWTLLIGWLSAALPVFTQDAADASATESTSAVVLEVIGEMPVGGGYEWKSTGVPHPVMHEGRVVLAQTKANGTYCSGVTFAAVVETATRAGLLDGVAFERVKQFQRDWYGTHDDAAETQCVYAMNQLGIGRAVRPRDARPGDFVQFWRRGGSGHSVVFIDWVLDADSGEPVGLIYWSSQTATAGIGTHVEYFAGQVGPDGREGRVLPERLYLGRLDTPGS
ncbi:MAG: hypothetical protein AAGE65_03130 [Planctomycetota bacterium]